MVVSQLDCTGCGNCAQVCPAKEKALVMKPLETQLAKTENWDYAMKKVAPKANPMNKNTVKGVQFEQPLFEFSGACAYYAAGWRPHDDCQRNGLLLYLGRQRTEHAVLQECRRPRPELGKQPV